MMNDVECCRRRSTALSNMLKWYYMDHAGSVYGAVDSFKLVYYIYVNYFEETTPFMFSTNGCIQADTFDDLIRHLPRLERDFNENCIDVFRCSHYMDALLRGGDGEFDEDIVLIKRGDTPTSRLYGVVDSSKNGVSKKNDVSDFNYDVKCDNDESNSAATLESININDTRYSRETSVVLTEDNAKCDAEKETKFPISAVGVAESKVGTHNDEYELSPIGIPSPKLPTTAMEACKLGNLSSNICGSSDAVVSGTPTNLGTGSVGAGCIKGTKYVPLHETGSQKYHDVQAGLMASYSSHEPPRSLLESDSMTKDMISLSEGNSSGGIGKRSSSAKMISLDSVMASNRNKNKDNNCNALQRSESKTRMSGIMLTQQMLIKQRMQSNLREAHAHLARIPSRKVSHVLSQSQPPLTSLRRGEHKLTESLHGY